MKTQLFNLPFKENQLYIFVKGSRMKRFLQGYFVMTLLLLSNFYAFSQKDTSHIRDSRDDCFGIEKINTDYKIMVDTFSYDDEDQVFICAKTAYAIQVVYAENENEVEGIDWDWSGCNCSPATPIGAKAEITLGKNKKMKVSFVENNPEMTTYQQEIKLKLSFKLIKKVEIDSDTTHLKAIYAFDDNNFTDYPFYHSGKPWKYLSKANTDVIAVKEDNIIVRHAKLNSMPTDDLAYSINDKEITLTYDGFIDTAHLYSHICDLDTLFKTDVYPNKTIKVDIYRLAERDDDYENYCVNKDTTDAPRSGNYDYDGSLAADCVTKIGDLPNADNFECINRGEDATLDYYIEVSEPIGSFYTDKDNDISKPIDIFKAQSLKAIHDVKVFPSISSGEYFCNERVLTNPNLWNFDTDGDGINDAFVDRIPGEVDYEKIKNNLDSIYSKVGVSFDIFQGPLLIDNYENNNWGGFEGDYKNFSHYHIAKFGNQAGDVNGAIKTRIWIVDSLVNASGFAIYNDSTNNPVNTLVVSVLQMKNWTVPHEVGHAKFELYHPDGSACLSGGEEGWKIDKLKAKVTSDKFNFMNSGCLQNTFNTKLSDFRIRRYQWIKIKKKK